MSIQIACQCGYQLATELDSSEKQINCPFCGSQITIPAGEISWEEPTQRYEEPTEPSSNRTLLVVIPFLLFFGAVIISAWQLTKHHAPPSSATKKHYKSPTFQEKRFDIQEEVRRGNAGEAFQRLYSGDHAIYLERAKAGDPDVRPLGQNAYEYMAERSKKEEAAD